ncbi:MAG: G-D-S-L family lipolytic protein [Chitinophagaceae bacterium]|nr:G-D-S-L family lipolytic protein [Chitinophagaceae bacterium]
MKKFLLLVFVLLGYAMLVAAQPFRKEIDAFKKQDSLQMPATRAILFVGSSSFTKWTDVQDYFPGYPIINRGFGGSSLPDLIRYANEIIIPYQPKQIIIYCGENDMADAWGKVTPDSVLARFQTLMSIIRKQFRKVPVVFISIKPSPSRWKMEADFVRANELVKAYLRKQRKTRFLDVHNAMLLPDGSVNPELFIKDNLHMNAQGYAIWQKIIAPVLKR